MLLKCLLFFSCCCCCHWNVLRGKQKKKYFVYTWKYGLWHFQKQDIIEAMSIVYHLYMHDFINKHEYISIEKMWIIGKLVLAYTKCSEIHLQYIFILFFFGFWYSIRMTSLERTQYNFELLNQSFNYFELNFKIVHV